MHSSSLPSACPSPAGDGPIGVFDSGIGGLSVLQSLRAHLPQEDFIYLADSGHAPYGERGDDFVRERSLHLTEQLVQWGAKAVVVACNTATAAAIHTLRARWPELPLVGVEPALKPAARLTHTGRIAVLATRGTLESPKFKRLLAQQGSGLHIHCQPCDGLADAIEHVDEALIERLCAHYLDQSGPWGTAPHQTDTLVLGCTHYPLLRERFQTRLGGAVTVLDTGEPVAQQTARLLQAAAALRPSAPNRPPGSVRWFSSGPPEQLNRAVTHWLHWPRPDSRPLPD